MSSLRLLLVRHGETPSNVLGLLDSLPPGPSLTPLGRQQADALADRLATEPVVAVYSSVAVRAQETAAPVAARHGLPVRVVAGLHEVSVGDLECSNIPADVTTFVDVYQAWHAGSTDVPMPGGETGRQVLDRYLPVIARIRSAHLDGAVVLVGHSAAIRLVGRTLSPNVTASFADTHFVRNCHTIILEADGPGWRCLDWAGTPPA